jgi:hypothetical protein
MPRFIPTLPRWACLTCGKPITRHRAYRWVEIFGLFGIQRARNGSYCIACASAEARSQETLSKRGKQ